MAMSEGDEPPLSGMVNDAPPCHGESLPKRARLETATAQASAAETDDVLPGRPAGPLQWKHIEQR
eukprot:4792572-Amphidinium_carterae.3